MRRKLRCCLDKELSRMPLGLLISCLQCYSCQSHENHVPWFPAIECSIYAKLSCVNTTLPSIRELLQSTKGCKYFTALDHTWGFWALAIVEEDQHKTSFTGPDGEVYVWTKAPMGLTNSPAAFQWVMAHVLRNIKGVSVSIYDITIFSKTWKENLRILIRVFERLKKSGLKVKYAKCG